MTFATSSTQAGPWYIPCHKVGSSCVTKFNARPEEQKDPTLEEYPITVSWKHRLARLAMSRPNVSDELLGFAHADWMYI